MSMPSQLPLARLEDLGDGGGLARSRDLGTGQVMISGFFVPGRDESTDGSDRAALPLSDCAAEPWWPQLEEAMDALEARHRDAIEVDFAVEAGRLRVRGTRSAPRDPAAACAVAEALMAEGRLEPAEALDRVTPAQFAAAIRPSATVPPEAVLGRGLGVSPGAASGIATFDPDRAVERGKRGEPVVLIRQETRPEDLAALLAATALVTIRGGRTSHAAVVARSIDRPCVVGLADATIDRARGVLDLGVATIADGDLITVDGSSGVLTRGDRPRCSPADGRLPPGPVPTRLLAAADAHRRMAVWVNADTPEDAAAARRAGATGIGLCRTEHMFLGDRQRLLAEILLGVYDSTAQDLLEELHRLQRSEFGTILAAMDGLPVTVRLLDPPRHEFLPDLAELSVRTAVAAVRGDSDPRLERRLRVVESKSERNPMVGVRGVRLGVLLPWIYEMQITALVEATMAGIQAGARPCPMLLVPMVATAAELRPILAFTRHLLQEMKPLVDRALTLPVGVMIETPRAALTAGDLAEVADFFSFGTNDLTQLTWGLSRDDTEAAVLRPYRDLGIIDTSPFEHLDLSGVGQLIAMAVQAGRRVRPGLRMGVCGEHAADPDSILAFHELGLDYISCSRQDVAMARYAAGYAARRPVPGAKGSGE